METPADINSTLLVSDRGKQSGMLMMAGEQSQIMTYFVPQLGPAPRWCSFLEGITEELEEEKTSTVYEDFKFLTKFDVEELGASSLIGTEHLRAYMHGYFMEMKMYQSLRAVAKPFEYEEHRKKRINDKLEEKRGSRIIPKKKLPKVNKQLAEKMLRKAERDSKSGKQSGDSSDDEEGEGEGEEERRGKPPTGLVDERFASLFSREEFQQDPDSLEYQLRNPTQAQKERRSRQHDGDEEDDLQDMYEEVSDDDEDEEEEEEEEDDDDKEEEEEEDEEEDFDSDIEVRNPDRGVGEDEGWSWSSEEAEQQRARARARVRKPGGAKMLMKSVPSSKLPVRLQPRIRVRPRTKTRAKPRARKLDSSKWRTSTPGLGAPCRRPWALWTKTRPATRPRRRRRVACHWRSA